MYYVDIFIQKEPCFFAQVSFLLLKSILKL